MIHPLRWILSAATAAALLAQTSLMAGDPQPDFLLQDANPNSPRSMQFVSPRDYQQQVSAYYFGQET